MKQLKANLSLIYGMKIVRSSVHNADCQEEWYKQMFSKPIDQQQLLSMLSSIKTASNTHDTISNTFVLVTMNFQHIDQQLHKVWIKYL